MNSFKDIAYQILKEAGKPLHSKEITKIAFSRGLLKTAGKTPEATMNAQLVVDTNSKGELSRFKKIGPSIFTINDKKIEIEEESKSDRIIEELEIEEEKKSRVVILVKQGSTQFFQSCFLGGIMPP